MPEFISDELCLSWIDSHCHLGENAAEVVSSAQRAGVLGMITVGTDLATSRAAIEVAQKFEGVWATAGVHPHEARHGLAGIPDLLDQEFVVAVGETGLDFHYDHSPRNVQMEIFAAQVALANEREMPLVVHTRKAWNETFLVLDKEGIPEKTVFHCFSGGPDEAIACLERGALLSFSGIATFEGASDVRDAVAGCPVDRIMLETDSPYLAPVPLRGRPNEPANLVHVGNSVAETMGLPVEDIAKATLVTACEFYGLESKDFEFS